MLRLGGPSRAGAARKPYNDFQLLSFTSRPATLSCIMHANPRRGRTPRRPLRVRAGCSYMHARPMGSYLWIPMDTSERRLLSLYIQLQILSSFQVGWIKTGWFGVIFELDKFTFPVLVQTIFKTVDTGGIN